MDALETQLTLQRAAVKSPGFAAILGFFFPAFGAFYTRRIAAGLLFMILDFFNLIFVIVGIGVITGLLFRLVAGYLAYSWASAVNQAELEQLLLGKKREGQMV